MKNIIILLALLLLGIFAKSSLVPDTPTYTPSDISKDIIKPPFIPTKYLSQHTRYPFNINGIEAEIPYATNLKIDQNHPEITRLVLAIHSSSYNPDYYLDNVLLVLDNKPSQQQKTLIITPAFYRQDKTSLSDIMVWRTSPFWGGSRGLYKGKKVNLSAYEILDDILEHIITSNHFPNLRDIIILGHSAGGQLVNRYAAVNRIEDTIAIKHNISISYLVMAPSSYVYLDAKRIYRNDDSVQFRVPFNAHKKYNNWGYGLKHLYGYHKRHHITRDMIRFQYQYRNVLYLVGSKDTKKAALDQSKSAMLEGKNRLQRLKNYYLHLQNHYGQEITEYHHMAIIQGVGHSSRRLMLSDEGKRFILQ